MKYSSKQNYLLNNQVDKRFLIKSIAKKLPQIPYKNIIIVVNVLIELLTEELLTKGEFVIKNFGIFKVKKYHNFIFKNIKTGNKQLSKEVRKLSIILSSKLKKLIKEKYREENEEKTN